MSIGKRISQLREYLKLSQKEFGDKIFRGKSTISQLENEITELTPALRKTICHTFNVSEEWLAYGLGSMTEEWAQEEPKTGKTTWEYVSSGNQDLEKMNSDQLDHSKISEDMFMAYRVLKSGTCYATALHMNIRSFADAVDEKQRRSDLEAKQLEFESRVNTELESLKDNFNSLKAENLTLRTENNRLKATHEGPHGDNGSATATEKKAM